MKSFMAKKNQIESAWKLVDADGQILGRLASRVAMILMGKDKPCYTPHIDVGDHVVIINAEKIQVSGNKAQTKVYDRYTHFPGGYRVTSFEDLMAKHPERIVELAVKRMLPKNKIGSAMFKKLKVYSGPEHNQAAQKPEKMEI